MCRLALAAWALKFVRTHFDQPRRVAVIRGIKNHNLFAFCMSASKPESQFIRLASGIYKKANTQRMGECGAQPLCIKHKIFMQVSGVCIQYRHLLLSRFYHARMAVAHMRNVVYAIQIGASIFIVQMLHVSADYFERILIRETQGAPKVRSTQFCNLLFFHIKTAQAFFRDFYDQIWIRADSHPEFT